jgi:polyketide biosynthesis enoyl-CoA hydratase PksI
VKEAVLTDPSRRVSLRIRNDGLWEIVMADHAGKNSFSEPFVAELEQVLDFVNRDSTVKVVVLRGLPEVFAAGAPRELLVRLARGEVVPTEIVLSKAMLDIPVPTIAAMQGHATGGGLALGLCADIVLMARESRYGASFMNMGFTPGMGMTRLLEHVLSPAMAQEMLYTGEFRKGASFVGASGINYILPKGQVCAKALDVAEQIAEKPRCSLELLKRSLSVRRRQAFEESRTLEAMMHSISFTQDEIRERIEGEYVE